MIDPFDYKEPSCVLCGGEDFYYPDAEKPAGRIPIDRIIQKLDAFFEKNDLDGADKHLTFWHNEALSLNDKQGELTIVSEMIGFFRKTGDAERAAKAVSRGIELVECLNLADTVSGATVYLNAATTMKAFGNAQSAMPYYDRAADVYEKVLDGDDRRKAGLYNNRALTYADLGKNDLAEKDYLSAIDVLSKTKGNDNEIAVTYVNYAHLVENDKTKSVFAPIELMKKAWDHLNDQSIVRNGNHAQVCEKCAPSFAHFGFNAEAKELAARSKEIYERN